LKETSEYTDAYSSLPETPQKFSNLLRRQVTAMRNAWGLDIHWGKSNGNRQIIVTMTSA